MHVDVPGFLGGDRTSPLDLPQQEEDLLKAVKSTGKPLVVTLMNGSALSLGELGERQRERHRGRLVLGRGGRSGRGRDALRKEQSRGAASGDVLHGRRSTAVFTDYSMKERTYRYFHGTPLYPFGYGLSYTHFAYSHLRLTTKPRCRRAMRCRRRWR